MKKGSSPDEQITRAIRVVGIIIAIEQAVQEVAFHVPASPLVTGLAALMMAGAPVAARLVPTTTDRGDRPDADS